MDILRNNCTVNNKNWLIEKVLNPGQDPAQSEHY